MMLQTMIKRKLIKLLQDITNRQAQAAANDKEGTKRNQNDKQENIVAMLLQIHLGYAKN